MDYVNPFGSYAQGYGQGVQQENTLQQDTRKARDEDYRYKNLNPLELSNAKIDNDYRLKTEGTQVQGAYDSGDLLHDRLKQSHLTVGTDLARATGDPNATQAAAVGIDPYYQYQPAGDIQRRADHADNVQDTNANTNAVYRQQVGQSDQEKAYAARYRADVYGERYQPGAAAPAPVGAGGMFGSPAPAHPAMAYGYDPQQHGAATQAWMRDNHTPNYSTQHPQQQGQQIYDLSQSTGMPLEAAHSVLSTTPYEAPPEPSAADYYTTDQ
jgi:hypothetical protein